LAEHNLTAIYYLWNFNPCFGYRMLS